MDQIFAPWRIEWVERDDTGERAGEHDDEDDHDCPFCTLPARGNDVDARVVARSEHTFVLFNNYPYNPGHVMVIPYRHTGEYGALSDAELLDHARLKARTFDAIETAMGPDAFNAGLNLGGPAGGSIEDHIHTHVVPRWGGDTNFMPVIADTSVIVEAIDDSYERVHEAFAAQPDATVAETGAVRLRFD